MEDAHTAVLDLDGSEEISNAFFAVYDGHGGVFLSPAILTLEVQLP
jgi:serine/threonine protein phosphatase PrpC